MKYLDAINYGNKSLKLSNIQTYNLDSELLLAKVLNCTRESLLINLHKNLENKYFINFKKLIIRRMKFEPIAHIFKKKEFWKYKFNINKNVLIPRPETEIIVDTILKLIDSKSSKSILDIGTGSGCLIISIIKERQKCNGIAIDISKKALKVAISNAKMHHLQNKIKFINIDIDKFILNKYDFIVSNPPYIRTNNLKRLEHNVKLFEPRIALEAGIDGFRVIKKIIIKSNILLKKNGKLIFEIGENQLPFSKHLLKTYGFYINEIHKDINKIPRTIVSTKIN